MREVRIYITEFILAIVACTLLSLWTSHENGNQRKNYIKWNDAGWTVATEDGILMEESVLPHTVPSTSGTLLLERKLTEDECKENNTLVYMTVHTKTEIYIDEELVYSIANEDDSYSKSRGHNWNCLDLYQDYAGKTMKIYLEYPYKTKEMSMPTFYLGNDLEITSDFIKNHSIAFMISIFMILIGILLILIYLFLGKDNRLEKRLVWIGWFSIAMGVWSVTETNVLILYMDNTLFLSQLAFITLKLTFTPVMMFYKESFKEKDYKLPNILCVISLVDVVVTTILQITGVADFKETVMVTHCYMAIGVCYIVYTVTKALVKGNRDQFNDFNGEFGVRNTIHAIGMVIVTISVIIDFVRYYSNEFHVDSARFSRIGLLIYILALGLEVIKNSLHLLDVEHEAEILKEEALLDPVTHLANRNSFDKDVSEIPAAERKNYGIIMCDLNGLKYFNDHYGHSMGDSYIFIAAELICDTFTDYGKTYRVGGDEFVILTTGLSKEVFVEIYDQMNEKIDAISKSCFEERMGIAAGFAMFDPSKDSSLRDTEKRADERMYVKKKQMKEQNAMFRRTEDLATGQLVENPLLKKKE